MKKVQMGLILAVSAVFIFMVGCEEQKKNASSTGGGKINSQQEKTVAAENIQLQKDLQQKDLQIDAFKADIQLLKADVAKCEEAKKRMQKQSAEEMKPMLTKILNDKDVKTKELQEENAALKKEIEDLKAAKK